jgi:hypothetical protein
VLIFGNKFGAKFTADDFAKNTVQLILQTQS